MASAATAIEAGGVRYTLSGWSGGWTFYSGYVRVSLTFADGSGTQLGSVATVSTVTAADRDYPAAIHTFDSTS